MKATAIVLVSLLIASGIVFFTPYEDLEVRAEALPDYNGGYGYDAPNSTMYDHNGFAYSYLPDGIIKLELPWGYTTYFSYGITASYLGTPIQRTALDYTWVWSSLAIPYLNETGVSQGYDYTFTATALSTQVDWKIQFEFSHDSGTLMKITHSMTSNLPNALTGVQFWYLFDLTYTPEPVVLTTIGSFEAPLYSDIPDSVWWIRLSNQFQFNWRDVLDTYSNGKAYIGDGSVIGLDGLEILGISIDIGDIPALGSFEVDPYFSGVTRTWAATGNSYSGIASNWSPVGVPATGDNITFDATSVFNCNWNTSVSLGTFSMNTGYTGTVTQAQNIWMVSYSQTQGTFTGSVSYTLNVSVSFTVTGTVFTSGVSRLDFWGTTITGGGDFYRVRIYSSTNVTSGALGSRAGGFQNNGDIILYTAVTYIAVYTSGPFTNNGTISGAGILRLGCFGGAHSVTTGKVTSQVHFRLYSSASSNENLTVTSSVYSSSYFRLDNQHATYSLYVNLANDVNSVTFLSNARSYLVCNAFKLKFSGSFDSSQGNINEMTSTFYLTGTGSTVKTATGESFYNLIVGGSYTTQSQFNVTNNLAINSTKSLTLGANAKTWNFYNNGTLTEGAYSLTVNNDQASVFTSSVPGDTSFNWLDSFSYDANSSDREAETPTYSDNCTLSGSSINATTGVFNITSPPGGNGTYYVSIMVSDGNHTTYQNFSITIENEAPIFTSTKYTLYVDTDESYYYDANATDPEGESIFYSITTDCEFLVIDNSTGIVSGIPWESDAGTWDVAIYAYDGYVGTWQNYTVIVRNVNTAFWMELMLFFAFQIVIFAVIMIGYFKMPFLMIIGLIAVTVIAVPTIFAFGNYYMLGAMLIVLNSGTSLMGIATRLRGK